MRIKRLLHYEAHPEADSTEQDDVLLRLTALQAGDVVFDATLGLAADALVCAHRVGATGKVIGVEASLPLYALVREGLARHPLGARIEVRHGLASAALRSMPDASVDCVLFDPMFDRPGKASTMFEVLRRHANHAPLDEATLQEARRVARRVVVVKAGRAGHELQRLGLRVVPLRHTGPLVWATVPPIER